MQKSRRVFSSVISYRRFGFVGLVLILSGALIGLFLWFISASSSQAETIPTGLPVVRYVTTDGLGTACTVEAPCALQMAIDLSQNGDEVRVAEGLYLPAEGATELVTVDKTVTVGGGYPVGFDGPADPLANPTIWDGNGEVRVVFIADDVNPTVEGLTIRNGLAIWGAGIFNSSGRPTIRNSRIYNNSSTASTLASYGGAIYDAGYATIVNNEIFDNHAIATGGTFEAKGGAIYVNNDGGVNSTTIAFNHIYSNTTSNDGAATTYGGGIMVDTGQVWVEGNVIERNVAERGGGLATFPLPSPDVTIQSNLFWANEATSDTGGGLFLAGLSRFYNNTVAENGAVTDGGGLLVASGSIDIRNNIVANNSSAGTDGIAINPGITINNKGYNNYFNDTIDPEVDDPTNYTHNPGFVSDINFHLADGSDNIDAGDPNTPATVDEDFDGDARPNGAVIDVGADEYYTAQAGILFTPIFSETFVERESVAIFEHTLVNDGNVADSYSFDCDNDLGWNVGCPATVALGAGEEATVETFLTVPNVPAFTVATTLITATSQIDPNTTAQVVVQSTVAPQVSLTFTPNYSQTLYPGDMVTLTHILTNTGDYSDTITVSVLFDPLNWGDLIPENEFTIVLASGESTPVLVRVAVPENAAAGLANILQIAATSGFDPSVSATVSDTITARPTAGTRYISQVGSDLNNNCVLSESPCRTITHAVGQASFGDEIRIAKAANPYEEPLITLNTTVYLSGGWNAPFTGQEGAETTQIEPVGNTAIFRITGGFATISNLTLQNGNSNNGGALLVESGAQPHIEEVIFQNNSATGSGGAVYVSNGALLTIQKSQFVQNSAAQKGGALFMAGGTVELSQSRFLTNTTTAAGSTNGGGAIFVQSGLLESENNLFHTNLTLGSGGAVFAAGGQLRLGNNTLVSNVSNGNGGGLYNDGATMTVGNLIFFENLAGSGGAIYHQSGSTTANYNLIQGNSAPELVNVTAQNTIIGNPLFGELFRLLPGSPAVDSGNPATLLNTDFEDDFRPSDQGYDIGWDELAGCRAKRGELIYGSIQAAVDADATDNLILVTGTCRGTNEAEVDGQTVRQTVLIQEPLTIQGGWDAEFTTLTADLTIIDPEGEGRGIFVTGGMTVTLQKLAVINGNAAGLSGGPAGEDAGGGVYNDNALLTFHQVFVLTSTATLGGGLYNDTGSTRLEAFVYEDEETEEEDQYRGRSRVGVNTAELGGGLYNNTGSLEVNATLIYTNTASSGGGVYNRQGALEMTNSVLYGNQTTDHGAGIYNGGANANLLHLTFYGNSAGTANGGGLYQNSTGAGTTVVHSSVFQSNSSNSGPAIYRAAGTMDVDYNYYHDYVGQPVVNTNAGTHSVSDNVTPPGFLDPLHSNFHLADTAAARDIADPASPVQKDFDGDRRPSDQGFDMGADELAGCSVRLNGQIYGSLQLALSLAEEGDELQVAGICRGTVLFAPVTTNPNSCGAEGAIPHVFVLNKNVHVTGGWNADFTVQDDITILDAQNSGRAIYVSPGVTATIEGFSIIRGNAQVGAGVCVDNASPTLRHNAFYSHTASSGAGIYAFDSHLLLDGGNHIKHNEAANGAALYLWSSAATYTNTIQNNYFYDNQSTNGGAVYSRGANNLFWHNTVVSNTATSGGGFYVQSGSPDIRSNIIVSNTANNGDGIFGAGGNAVVNYNNFFGQDQDTAGSLVVGGQNLTADPLFTDLEQFDLTIDITSPVVDVADPALPLTHDGDADIRPSHQGYDMGADEVGGCYAAIEPDLETVYGSVQRAVDLAENGATILARGICYGVNHHEGLTQSLYLTKSLTINGAWNSLGGNDLALDAQMQGRGIYVGGGAVVTLTHVSVLNGSAADAGNGNNGGGLYNTGILVLDESLIYENSAGNGGGVYNIGTLTTHKTTLRNNSATLGAGFYNDGLANILYSEMYNNTATHGGAIYQNSATLLADGNILYENNATRGAGIYLHAGTPSGLTVQNNFLYRNSAGQEGGGIYNGNNNARILHNTLLQNSILAADGEGAGIYTSANTPDIRNNIVDRNFGAGIFVAGGTPILNFNNVFGNNPDYGGSAAAGPNDISQLPLYKNPLEDDYHLLGNSPGIDQATELNVPMDFERDLRPTNEAPDMGADEYDACLIRVNDAIFSVLQDAINYAETNSFDTLEIARGECSGVVERNGTFQVGYVSSDLTFIGSLRRTNFGDPDDFHNPQVGAVSSSINAEGLGRAIYIASGASPTFVHLAFVNGNGDAAGTSNNNGGGLYKQGVGDVTFTESQPCQNVADNGGGYYGDSGSYTYFSGSGTGSCAVARFDGDTDQVIGYDVYEGNQAINGNGGGIYISSGATFDITNHGVNFNSATGNGGGVYNGSTSASRLINLILYANEAVNGDGGGIYNAGILQVYHSTIRANTASDQGGGVYNSSGQLTLDSSILFENTAADGGGLFSVNTNTSGLRYNNFRDNSPNDANIGLGNPVYTWDPGLFLYSLSQDSRNIDEANPALLVPENDPFIDFDANLDHRPDGNPNHNGLYGKGGDIGADEYYKDFGCQVRFIGEGTKTANPGEVVTYTLEIENTGWPPPPTDSTRHGYTDTLQISLNSSVPDWVTFDGGLYQEFELDWFATVVRELTVTIPITTVSGVQELSEIRCRSASLQETDLYDSRGDEQIATTNVGIVNAIRVYPTYAAEAYPGQVLTFTHYVQNTGNLVDSYLLVPNPGVAHARANLFDLAGTNINSTTVTLAPTEQITVLLQVEILPTGAAGEQATPGVVAVSTNDPAIFGSALNTIDILPISATRYVAKIGATDSTNCTDPNFPCATIQRAVDQAVANDAILVGSGVYTDSITATVGVETLRLNVYINKPVLIQGGYDATDFMAPPQPITHAVHLSGQNQHGVIYITAGLTDTVRLSSLFIQAGNAPVTAEGERGGGIYNAGTDLIITGTWVLSNTGQYGSGLYQVTGTLLVNSSVFAGNLNFHEEVASGEGGGIYIANGQAQLENSTFARNSVNATDSQQPEPENSGNGGAVYLADGSLTFLNNIFDSNAANIGTAVYVNNGSTPTNDYNLYYTVSGDLVIFTNFPTGTNSIEADPLFVDSYYHIAPNSPAKDAGTTDGLQRIDVDFDLEERVQPPGGFIDIGADERVQLAEFSFVPTYQEALLDVGESRTYTHTLSNTGDFPDTYTFEVVHEELPPGGIWNRTVDIPDSVSLGIGESVVISFTISGDSRGYVDETTISATASSNNAILWVVDRTTITHTAGVEIGLPQSGVGIPGQSVQYSHILTNTGDGPDQFALSLFAGTPSDWGATVAPTETAILLAGETTSFVVTVAVPASAISGTVHTVGVRAETVAPYATASLTDTTTATASYGLLLEPDNARTVSGAGEVVYNHLLTNFGNGQDTVTLSYASNPNWAVTVEPEQVTVPAFSKQLITVTVTVPPDSEGLIHTAFITATSSFPGVYDTATNTTTVTGAPTAGIELTPSYSVTVIPGSEVVFTHTVTNTGNTPDSITLTANSDQSWLMTPPPSSVTLDVGESETFVVVLEVPVSATAGTLDQTTVTATSTNDPAVSESVMNQTTVAEPPPVAIDLSPNSIQVTAQPGETVVFTHTLTNLGDSTDTIVLAAFSTLNWLTGFPPSDVTLLPGASEELVLVVEVPADATNGLTDLTTLFAQSTNDTSVTDQATDQTTVTAPPPPETPTLYLPIVLKSGSPPPPTPTPTPTATATPTPTPCTPTGIDLVVTAITLEPSQPVAGQPVRVSVTIRNQGSTNIAYGNNFYLDFYVDDQPELYEVGNIVWGVQGADLEAGATVTFSQDNFIFSSGGHQLWAQVDTDNTVNECPNEGNNVFGPLNLNVVNGGVPASATLQPNIPPSTAPRQTPTPFPIQKP